MNKKVYKFHTFSPLFINRLISGTTKSHTSLQELSLSLQFKYKLLLTAVPTKAENDRKITPVWKPIGGNEGYMAPMDPRCSCWTVSFCFNGNHWWCTEYSAENVLYSSIKIYKNITKCFHKKIKPEKAVKGNTKRTTVSCLWEKMSVS